VGAECTSVVKSERRKARHRALDAVFCAAFLGMVWVIAADLAQAVSQRPALLLLVPPIALLGHLSSDFMSGLLHWLADTYGTPSTPLLGPKFVTPFREHHSDPLAITQHDFLEANGDSCGLALTALIPAHLWLPIEQAGWAASLALYLLVLAVGALFTSVVHGWAHRADPPRIARLLQRAGLVLTPEHHELHHVAPHDGRYCITTGWLNPLLDRTRFFRRLEAALARVGIRRSS